MSHSRRGYRQINPEQTTSHQDDRQRKRTLFHIWVAWGSTAVIDYCNSASIYLGYLFNAILPTLAITFSLVARLVLFPLSAIATTTYAILAWSNAFLDREVINGKKQFKKENLIRASVQSISALLIVSAVIIGLAFAAAAGMATAVMYGIYFGITGLYHLSNGAYYLYQAHKLKTEINRIRQAPHQTAANQALIHQKETLISVLRGSAFSSFAFGTTTTLVAIAGAIVVLGGFAPMAILGIVSSLVGAGFCAYGLAKAVKNHMKEQETHHNRRERHSEEANDNTVKIEQLNSSTQKRCLTRLGSGRGQVLTTNTLEKSAEPQPLPPKPQKSQPPGFSNLSARETADDTINYRFS